MAEHSPGPWRFVEGPAYESDSIRDANDEPVIIAHVAHYEYPELCVKHADAVLAAAAPEMLEILRRIAGLRYAENMDGSADELIARLGYEPIPEERKKFPP